MAGLIQGVLDVVANAGADDEGVQDVLAEAGVDDECAEAVRQARLASFEDGMVMTRDAGFTVRLQDGTEFQVSVIRSR